MELVISSLLRVILLWNSLCVSSSIFNTASHSHNEGEPNPPRVRPITSVYRYPGQTLELQCADDGNEEVARWWRTPFGLFEGCNRHSKDPVETCNSSLRISKVTTSHDGIYLCERLDEAGRTILPYRVNVLNPSMQLRTTRDAEGDDDMVPDTHFVGAVTSSVIVTFIMAFTLGAFTRSYVIKCLHVTRAHMPYKKNQHHRDNPEHNTNNTQAAPFERAHFYIDHHTGEDTVDIGNEDLIDQDGERDGDVDDAANERGDGGNDESYQPQSGEEQNQEFETVSSPHPKKKSRVIKVYNYDEEGNRYGHIKDSEVDDEVRARIRTKSLTRLDAIMKRAESVDFNPVKESSDSQLDT